MTDFFNHTKKQLFWKAGAIFFIKTRVKCCSNVKMGDMMWKWENLEICQWGIPGAGSPVKIER
jgi:hypothetical protein